MNSKLLLCLALVLSDCLCVCSNVARADETNVPVSTNAVQSFVPATLKTNWTDTKITLCRTTGETIQLDAKCEVVAVRKRGMPTPIDVNVVAFVDPDTGNAWVGSSFGFAAVFYLETESGIVRGTMLFGSGIRAVRPDEHDVINGLVAFGHIYWDGSLVPNVQRGKNLDAVIEQLNKTNDLKWVATETHRERITFIEDSLYNVETGLNPWFFIGERHGKQFKDTTIEAINVSDGKLQLDLKNPAGSHKASVWIDLKTWKVVKVVQDRKP